jgi:beta-lactam-binding protein with PASTA domain
VSTVTVPSVVGLTLYQAWEALWAAGLVVTTSAYSYDPTAPLTSVLAQSISAGSIVQQGSNIFLTLSLGVAPVAVLVTVP